MNILYTMIALSSHVSSLLMKNLSSNASFSNGSCTDFADDKINYSGTLIKTSPAEMSSFAAIPI